MVQGPEKADNAKARVVADKLIDQLTEMEQLFTFGEKLYSYENIRGNDIEVNEDLRRKQMARGAGYGPTSITSLYGSSFYGLGAVYLYSRIGANTLFDLGPLRRNIWFSMSIFCLGTGIGGVINLMKVRNKEGGAERIQLNLRAQENQETHALCRSMIFHLKTRNMSIWDQQAA